MITAVEIQKKAQRLYTAYLESVAAGRAFFPCPVRSNKQVSADFLSMQKEMAALAAGSTDRKGYGYTLVYEAVQTRRHGVQNLPVSILFESEAHYLKFIGKEHEAAVFKKNCGLICRTLPPLREWCIQQVHLVVEEADCWSDLLKVCCYFLSHPRPELYIRELPVEVHTKFIEQHKAVLHSLLHFLLPDSSINAQAKNFCPHFYLKEAEPLIRFRLLDPLLASPLFGSIDDLSVPVSQFCTLDPPCSRVFIVENKMTFLTFPRYPGALVIWGQGFQVELLKGCGWLAGLPITYWGDMDVHGFLILSQVRGYFPQTRSLMMEWETFAAFAPMAVANPISNPPAAALLTSDEELLFQHLLTHALRLEQEKITQAYAVERVMELG